MLSPQDEEGAAPSSAAAPDPRRLGPVLSRMRGAGVAVGTHTARSHPHGRAAVLPALGLFPNCLPYCWPFRQHERGLPLWGEAQWPLPKGLEGAKGLQSSRRGPSLPGCTQAPVSRSCGAAGAGPTPPEPGFRDPPLSLGLFPTAPCHFFLQGGDAKLQVIVCVSPGQRHVAETLQSLRFGARARQVERGRPAPRKLR